MGLLSETQIRAAKPGPKEYMLNDGDNLYLRVRAAKAFPRHAADITQPSQKLPMPEDNTLQFIRHRPKRELLFGT